MERQRTRSRKKKQNGREGISLGTDVPSTISEMIHVQGSSINDVMQIWTIFDLTAPNITSLASVAIKSLTPRAPPPLTSFKDDPLTMFIYLSSTICIIRNVSNLQLFEIGNLCLKRSVNKLTVVSKRVELFQNHLPIFYLEIDGWNCWCAIML